MNTKTLIIIIILLGLGVGGFFVYKGIPCKDSLDCPSHMKCENSVCVGVGCIKEGETGPSGGISPAWKEHLPTECCQGLESITYPGNYDENCNSTLAPGAPAVICSKCGNGICEKWETKCNCPEDCGEAI